MPLSCRPRSAYIIFTMDFRKKNSAKLKPHDVSGLCRDRAPRRLVIKRVFRLSCLFLRFLSFSHPSLLQVMAQAASLWKVMGEAERAPFVAEAAQEREQRNEELRQWREAHPDEKTVYTKREEKSTVNYVKRSAYSVFLEIFQRDHAKEYPTEKALVASARTAWEKVDNATRNHYRREAKERAVFQKEIEDEKDKEARLAQYDEEMKHRLTTGQMPPKRELPPKKDDKKKTSAKKKKQKTAEEKRPREEVGNGNDADEYEKGNDEGDSEQGPLKRQAIEGTVPLNLGWGDDGLFSAFDGADDLFGETPGMGQDSNVFEEEADGLGLGLELGVMNFDDDIFS